MFFKKHHIVIFKDGGQGESKRYRIRLGLLSLVALFACILLVGNIWLAQEYVKNSHLQSKLENAEKTMAEQTTQLLLLNNKIESLNISFARIEKFDAKMRHMLELNSDLGQVDRSRDGEKLAGALPLHRPTLMARRMQSFLDLLEGDMLLEEVNQQELLQALRLKQKALSTSPSIWPLRGRINSSFGYRNAPFTGKRSFHKGIDIKGTIGAPIVASAAGTVTKSGYSGAYGILVEINHGGGIITKYSHMQNATVKVGDKVKRGDMVGRVGMTGRTTGPHLHYEVVVNGVPRDPMKYMFD